MLGVAVTAVAVAAAIIKSSSEIQILSKKDTDYYSAVGKILVEVTTGSQTDGSNEKGYFFLAAGGHGIANI